MKLAELTFPKAAEAFKKQPVAVLPLGTVEVHGRHLPLNTDMLAPEDVVRRMEAKMGEELLVLPSWHYGNCDSQTEFPGTLSLSGKLLDEVLLRIFMSLYEQGLRYFAVVNGHGPNAASVERVAYALRQKGAHLAVLNWWRYVWDINPAWRGGHGGGQETSAVLALRPDLVEKSEYEMAKTIGLSEEFPANGWDNVLWRGVNIPIPRPDIHVTDNGWLGEDPLETATAQQGEEMLEAAAEWAVDYLRAMKRY